MLRFVPQPHGKTPLQMTMTIGVCIIVQIGECGNFSDVQIGERGANKELKLPWNVIVSRSFAQVK